MLKTVALDGPDFAGKSTLAKMIAGILEAMGYRVSIQGHPCNKSETGQYARRLLVTGMANDVVAEAMCKDFAYTLEYCVPEYDVVILDRWTPVTIANQGDEGKAAVFRSKVNDHPLAPRLYISMETSYEIALARNKKRLIEKGMDWDEVVSSKMFVSPETWAAACERYRFAFHVITEGGNKFDWLRIPVEHDTSLMAHEIVRRILNN